MPSNNLGILGSLSLALSGSQYFLLMWQLEPLLAEQSRLTKWSRGNGDVIREPSNSLPQKSETTKNVYRFCLFFFKKRLLVNLL